MAAGLTALPEMTLRLAAALGSLSEDTACEVPFPTPCGDSLSHGAFSIIPTIVVLFRISRGSQYARRHLCIETGEGRGNKSLVPFPPLVG